MGNKGSKARKQAKEHEEKKAAPAAHVPVTVAPSEHRQPIEVVGGGLSFGSHPKKPKLATPFTKADAASLSDMRLERELSVRDVFSDGRFEDKYTFVQNLGQPGGYGRAAEYIQKSTGVHRAVKIISKRPFRKNPAKLNMFLQEMVLISTLYHPNIVHGYEAFQDKKNIYLVMELCTGGELYDQLKQHEDADTNYTEQEAAHLVKQMAEALQIIHAHGVAHCDLKPDNFLFSDNTPDAKIKIIDFNLARYTTRLKYFKNVRGTRFYMAPEVYAGRYTYHCDMWSLGVIVYLLLFGTPPFYGSTDEEISAKVMAGFIPEVRPDYGPWFPESMPVSDGAKDFIAKLLTNQNDRMTATEVLEHPWLNGHADGVPLPLTILSGIGESISSSKVKSTLLFILSTHIPQEELMSLKQAFSTIDDDHNGFITLEEVRQYLHDHPELSEDAKSLLKVADVNGDGQVCYTELVMASVQKRLMAKEERMWEVFCELDRDGDHTVEASELVSLLTEAKMEVTPEEVASMMDEIDENHDGKIEYDEFLHIFFGKHHDVVHDDFRFEKQQIEVRKKAHEENLQKLAEAN